MFGELTWHVTDAWQVTGGVRAFWGSFDQDYVQLLPLCGAPCANDGVDPLGTTAASSSENYDDQVFKLNTSYDFTDDLTGYFTWAEGYRHAGANALPTAGNFAEDPSLLTFGPDSANNFEVGLKGTIADRVQFSTAAFYITWEDFQFDTFTPVSGFQFVGNANEARSQGVELEMAARITDGLTATVGYTYTDAELTEDFTIGERAGLRGRQDAGRPGALAVLDCGLRPPGLRRLLAAIPRERHVPQRHDGRLEHGDEFRSPLLPDRFVLGVGPVTESHGRARDGPPLPSSTTSATRKARLAVCRLPTTRRGAPTSWSCRPLTFGLRLSYSWGR